MKKAFITIVLIGFCAISAWSQSLEVFVSDSNGDTNVRNAPKGTVVAKLSQDGNWMFSVETPKNGWWRIQDGAYSGPDTDELHFKGSKTGYWIHSSVIGVSTRNYGGERLSLRQSPSDKAAVVYSFTDEVVLNPIDIKGDWVKVTNGKYTGWIEAEWLCGNAVTNCC